MKREHKNPLTIVQKSEYFGREINTKEVLQRVIQFIVQKGILERREQSDINKTMLGGTSFWIKNTKDVKGMVINYELCFSNLPDKWNFEQILFYIDAQEKQWLMKCGVNIEGYAPPKI